MNTKPLFHMAPKLAAALWLMALSQGAAQPGVVLWTNRYNGLGNGRDQATALAVDGSGNVVVTGSAYSYVQGELFSTDYATIKYSSAGVPLWTNLYNGPLYGPGYATAVAVDG